MNCRGFECVRCPFCKKAIQCHRRIFDVDLKVLVRCIECQEVFELELDLIKEEVVVRKEISETDEGHVSLPPSGVMPEPLSPENNEEPIFGESSRTSNIPAECRGSSPKSNKVKGGGGTVIAMKPKAVVQFNLDLCEAKDPPEVTCHHFDCPHCSKACRCQKRTNLHNDPNFDWRTCPFRENKAVS